MVAQTPGLCMALGGVRSHKHQLMPPHLLQDLGLRLTLGNSPDITLDSGGKQAIRISLFLTPLTSSDLSPLPMDHSTSLSLRPPHPVLDHHNGV